MKKILIKQNVNTSILSIVEWNCRDGKAIYTLWC